MTRLQRAFSIAIAAGNNVLFLLLTLSTLSLSAQLRFGRMAPGAQPVTITLTSMPNGLIDTVYASQTVTATGGTAPYTCTLASGALPTGITETAECVYGGTTTGAASYTFEIRATDTLSADDTQSYTIEITGSDYDGYRPHYQGPGSTTNGGRGGEARVMVVNTLTISGTPTWGETGDLRDAIEGVPPGCTVGAETIAACARYVVFGVSGTIDLGGNAISVLADYITVAGQTAPTTSEGSCVANCTSPGGILLKNGALHVKASHVAIQHLRIRPGVSYTLQAVSVGDFSDSAIVPQYVVFDHVSVSWGGSVGTSNFGFDGEPSNIQIVDSIVSEPLSPPGGGYGLLFGGGASDPPHAFALVRSLLAHQWFRNPWAGPGTRVTILNNLVYNADIDAEGFVNAVASASGGFIPGAINLSIIGNVFDRGPNSGALAKFLTVSLDAATMSAGTTTIYLLNNDGTGDGTTGTSGDGQWAGVSFGDIYMFPPDTNAATEGTTRINTAPTYYSDVPWQVLSTASVATSVRANAGAFPLNRDAVDARVVQDTIDLDGTNDIANETAVGGYPTIAERTRTPGLPTSPGSTGTCGNHNGTPRTRLQCALETDAAIGSQRIEAPN